MWYPWTSDFVSSRDRLVSLSDIFRQLDRVRTGAASQANNSAYASEDGEPATTLLETAEGYEFRIEVPGVSQKELTLDVHDQTLTLSARREVKPREGWSTHRAERTSFAWKRAFSFPTKLDAERTAAKLEHGILTVKVAKAPENQPRRVKIGVA